MRGGRGNNPGRRGPNPLTRSYESNGPDVKVRGTPQHIAEKYVQLARDAHSSSDTVMAESYLQHAEHYYRIIAAAQNAQQQAYNQANGIPTTESDQQEDEDEFEVAGADRFTFRAPQNFNQQGVYTPPASAPLVQQNYQQQGQTYNGDLAGTEQPQMPEGQPLPAEGGQPYQPPPRGDRPQFGNRRFDERNNRRFGRDRPQGDRPFGGDRPQGDRPHGDRGAERPADRGFGDRQQGERPPSQPRHEQAAQADEQPGLPSFITAPLPRPPEPEASVVGGAPAEEAGVKPRRRRRVRAGAPGEAPEAGGEE